MVSKPVCGLAPITASAPDKLKLSIKALSISACSGTNVFTFIDKSVLPGITHTYGSTFSITNGLKPLTKRSSDVDANKLLAVMYGKSRDKYSSSSAPERYVMLSSSSQSNTLSAIVSSDSSAGKSSIFSSNANSALCAGFVLLALFVSGAMAKAFKFKHACKSVILPLNVPLSTGYEASPWVAHIWSSVVLSASSFLLCISPLIASSSAP